MYRKRHTIYRVKYYLQFQASTEGLRMYPWWIRGNYCTVNDLQEFFQKSVLVIYCNITRKFKTQQLKTVNIFMSQFLQGRSLGTPQLTSGCLTRLQSFHSISGDCSHNNAQLAKDLLPSLLTQQLACYRLSLVVGWQLHFLVIQTLLQCNSQHGS